MHNLEQVTLFGWSLPVQEFRGLPPSPHRREESEVCDKNQQPLSSSFFIPPLVGRDEKRAPLKTPAWEATEYQAFLAKREREKRKGEKANLPILYPSFPLQSKISSPLAPKEGLTRAKLVISSVTASYANQPTYFQIIIISSSFASASVGAFYFHGLS